MHSPPVQELALRGLLAVMVRSGTLESLVELLAEDEMADNPEYVETFVATHNYFIDSQSFMSR